MSVSDGFRRNYRLLHQKVTVYHLIDVSIQLISMYKYKASGSVGRAHALPGPPLDMPLCIATLHYSATTVVAWHD